MSSLPPATPPPPPTPPPPSSARKCPSCKRSEPDVRFSYLSNGRWKSRSRCLSCHYRAMADRRKQKNSAHVKRAVTALVEEKASRDLKAENRALAEDNRRLKTALNFSTRISAPPDILVYGTAKGQRTDATACALLSDMHVEELVVASDVNGLNEYNPDIAKARLERYFKNVLKLTNIFAHEQKINTIFLAALGDSFTGWLHEENIPNTAFAPADAANFAQSLIVSGLTYLLRNSRYNIEVLCIPGNHGRLRQHVHYADPTGTSMESLMFRMVARQFDGVARIRFDCPDRAMTYRNFYEKMKVRFIHGYEVKYFGGVGGLTIPLNKAIAAWDKGLRADLTCLGHFHTRTDGGRFLVNGSTVGFNTYSLAIKADFEKPSQQFFLVDARHGGEKTVVAPVFLDT